MMSLGLAPGPEGETAKNLVMAKFNIDLLCVLKEKTANNLNPDEQRLMDGIIADLQLRFIEAKKTK